MPCRKLGQIDFRLTLWSNIPSTISEKCNTNVWKQLSNITHSLFYCWPCVYVTLGVGFPIRNSRHAISLVFHFFLRFPRAEDSFSGEVTRYSKYVEAFVKKKDAFYILRNGEGCKYLVLLRYIHVSAAIKKSTNNYNVLGSHCSFSRLSFEILRLM